MKKKKLIMLFSTFACFAVVGGTTALYARANSNTDIQFSLDGTIGSSYAVNSKLELPVGTYTMGDEEFPAETIVYYPNGYGYETADVELTVHGQYVVQYRAKINGEWQINEYKISTEKNQYDFESVKSSAVFGEDQTMWNIGKKEQGLHVSLAKDDVFTYNEPINVRELEGDSFIKFNLLPNVAGVSDAATLHIQLVDAYDEDNYIDWQCSLGSGAYGYMMNKAKASGQSYVGIEYWKNQTVHIGNAYGGYIPWAPGGDKKTMTTTPQQLYYTISDNSLWWQIEHEQGRICDFDASYQGNPWTGFTSDYAYVRVYAETYNSDTFNILINKIGNIDLSKRDFVDVEGPVIQVETGELDLQNLPNAVIGKAYKIFDATATELFVGERPVSTRVYFNYTRDSGIYTEKSNDFTYELDTFGGRFTPDEVGKYSIVYTSVDYLGNYTEKVLSVYATQDDIEPITVELGERVAAHNAGNKIQLADIVALNGMIGETVIERKVLLNGEEVAVEGNDISGYSFIPQTTGTYEIIIRAKDVIGNIGEATYEVVISDGADPAFETESSLPLYYIQGEEYEINGMQAKDLTTGNLVASNITIIDGLGERDYIGGKVSFIPNADGVAIIRYSAGENVKEYSVPVVSVRNGEDLDLTKYFKNTAGKLEIKGEALGIMFTSRNTDGEATFVKPLLKNNLILTLRADSEFNDYEFVTITLRDSVDATQKVKVSIKKTVNGSNAELWLNGEKTKASIPNPFYNSANFNIKYNHETNRLSDGNSAGIELTHTVLGEPFEGFTSGEVYFTIGLEGVKSRSNLYINNINNQKINGDIISDKIYPETYLNGSYEDKSLPINTEITVHPMSVGDVLSSIVYSSVSVTYNSVPVVAVDGTVLSNVSIDESYNFVLSQNGKYTITYTVLDSAGRDTVRTYIFEVIDIKAPVIKAVSLPSEGTVGEVLKIPTTTAMDETDGEVKVTMYVIYPDLTVRVLTETKYFTFIQAGKYIVRYMAIDAMGNTSYLDYEIIVR